MSQQPISRSPYVPSIGPDQSKGEAAAAYNYNRGKAIHQANMERLESHFTPEEKAMQFGVEVASAVEGGFGLVNCQQRHLNI